MKSFMDMFVFVATQETCLPRHNLSSNQLLDSYYFALKSAICMFMSPQILKVMLDGSEKDTMLRLDLRLIFLARIWGEAPPSRVLKLVI